MSQREGIDVSEYQAAIAVAAATDGPHVSSCAVDATVLVRTRNFEEAMRQAEPLVPASDPMLHRTVSLVRSSTARATGLRLETAESLATSHRDPLAFAGGAQPQGTCAEIVVARAFRDHHAGRRSALVNAPGSRDNIVDVRLSPDTASARDLLFGIETPSGLRFFRPGGQVKLGAPSYVADSLVRMTSRAGYGKTAYVDASLLKDDGTPRVGPDAFTEGQAERLRNAGVRFRGVRNLDAQARTLVEDLKAYQRDGLDPRAREGMRSLRDEIAEAYEPSAVAGRIFSRAASAAATQAVLSLVVQLASNGEVNLERTGVAVAHGAAWGGGAALLDAGVFHAAVGVGMPEEAARSVARKAVTGTFCLVAIGLDVASEVGAVRHGEATNIDAATGVAAASAINMVPLALAAFGWGAMPIIVASQLGGRWTLAKWREGGRRIDQQFQADLSETASLLDRAETMKARVRDAFAASADIDRIVAEAMGVSVNRNAGTNRLG